MAQFYASIQGNRGEATRMGTKNSGISGHIRGWDIGCSVEIDHAPGGLTGDRVRIFLTEGSNGGNRVCLGCFQPSDFDALMEKRIELGRPLIEAVQS